MLFAKSFLHPNDIEAKSIFPSDFIALREVVYPLELVETLIKVTFARTSGPQDIPFMAVGVIECVSFKDAPDQFGVSFEQFVEHLAIFDVVAATWATRWERCVQQLRLGYGLNVDQLIKGVHWCCINVA